MESIQDWSKEYFLKNSEACQQKLKDLSAEERFALKRNLDLQENNKLVLFRGMIVDTREPEFYCETYEVKSLDGNTLRVENGKYSDKLNLSEGETVEDPSKHLSERQTILVTKHLSTNQWVDEVDQLEGSNKRKLEETSTSSSSSFTVKVFIFKSAFIWIPLYVKFLLHF